MPAIDELRYRFKRDGFRRFMVKYQYQVMVASLAMGFIFVGAYSLLEAHWFLSRLTLLVAIVAFTPAAIVAFTHLRELGPFLYWTSSNGEWTTRRSRKTVPAQMVDATLAWSLLAGVWNPRVFLGRWFKSSSTWSSCS